MLPLPAATRVTENKNIIGWHYDEASKMVENGPRT